MSGVGTKEIKRRKNSIENTRQITSAMNLVSSSKLMKAREKAEKSKPYAYALYDMMINTGADVKTSCKEFVEKREVKKRCFIAVAGDRGLAGGYNVNIFKSVMELRDSDKDMVVPVGKKACEYFTKKGFEIPYKIESTEHCVFEEMYDITQNLIKLYEDKEIDEIYFIYTKFRSALIQTVRFKRLFPIELEMLKKDEKKSEESSRKKEVKKVEPRRQYLPSAEALFKRLISEYTASQVYNGIRESFASEQASRRNAMQSATESADDMLNKLEAEYNRARQSSITREITEIAGGAEALK
ncbi:ATP synthase F1 subunit gamma [Peptacetobacter sp.]|uniref:ATP synthase F1 subunit gamma n=1 Tax=Peptacetobacter sp. TaxID=2991975 RepID=UPI00260B3A82|nr:ATP synthase F1 subunit gamma [Peptacetobacter sp.]